MKEFLSIPLVRTIVSNLLTIVVIIICGILLHLSLG